MISLNEHHGHMSLPGRNSTISNSFQRSFFSGWVIEVGSLEILDIELNIRLSEILGINFQN